VVEAKFADRAQRKAFSLSTPLLNATVRSTTVEQTGDDTAIGTVEFQLKDAYTGQSASRTFTFDITFDPETGALLTITPYRGASGDTSTSDDYS
jgi:hypothetical protein